MKVKLFSHTDLDGYGCNIVIKSVFKNVDCENLNYDKIDARIKEFITNGEYKNYDRIYITDISVNEETAKLIDNTIDLYIRLLDHHPTALRLNKYDWAFVNIKRDGERTSGTKMLYDELAEAVDIWSKESLFNIVENIRKYDTWLWKEKYNDITPKQLNDLFFILGADKFVDLIIKEIEFDNCEETVNVFLDKYKLLLDLQQDKIDRYVKSKNKEIIEYNSNGYKLGVVFAEQFQSELGNRLSELNPQYDIIAMIGDKTISYRTIKDNIDCGEFAKLFGGGGHPKASGSQINIESKLDYINKLFN